MSAHAARTVFPVLPPGMERALESDPVLLDGMEVLFDERVALYPVTLRARDKEPRGGARTQSRG